MEKKCEVCHENVAKYKCPGCMTRTCSVTCVKQHKTEQNCDGVRNKTAYVAVRNFTDINLLSDYRFLEDAGRKADSSNRENFENRFRSNWLRTKLVRQCKKHDIKLMTMPYHMTKRKRNRSRCHYESQSINWTVDWIFPQAHTKYTNIVNDKSVLSASVQQYIHPAESDPVIRQKLKPYIALGTDNVRLFAKVEGRNANSVRYYKLDKDKSLCDNLDKKLIIEHPTIHVVLTEHAGEYTLLKEDEEAQPASFQELMALSTSHPQYNHHGNQYGHHNRRGRGRWRGGHRNYDDAANSAPKLDT